VVSQREVERLLGAAADDRRDTGRQPAGPSPGGSYTADAVIFSAAHPGRAQVLTEWLDPSVVDERDPIAADATLDMYDSQHARAGCRQEFQIQQVRWHSPHLSANPEFAHDWVEHGGFEPPTPCLPGKCSPAELMPLNDLRV
jgi:hypothetical protein